MKTWDDVKTLVPYVVIGLVLELVMTKMCNLLALEDKTARNLGIMLSTHVTKTIKSRTQRNYCDKVTNGKHKQSPPFQEISLKSDESM